METPPISLKKPTDACLSKTTLTPCRRLGLSRPSPSNFKRTPASAVTPNQNKTPIQSTISSNKILISNQETDKQNTPLRTSNFLNRSPPFKARRCLTKHPNTPVMQNVNKVILNPSRSDSGNDSNVGLCDKTVTEFCKDINHSYKKRKISLKVPINCDKSDVSKDIRSSNLVTELCLSESQQDSPKFHENPVDSNDSDEKITPDVIEKLFASIKEKKKRLELLKVQETYSKKHKLEDLRAQTEKWLTAGKDALRYTVQLARSSGHNVTIKELISQHGFPKHLMGYNSEDDEFE